MPRPPAENIEALRARIKTGARGGEDADLLIAFSDELFLLKQEYSDHRHEKLLRHATRIAEHADTTLTATLDSKRDAKVAVRWINREYDNEETNRDYRVALRMVGKRATPGEDIPEALAWVSTKTSRSYDPSPSPAAMLDWEADIEPMLAESRNPRDKAAIALQMDAGLRGQELYELERGAITPGDHGMRVRVDGKTGERSITLIPSTPHVSRWLDEHPSQRPTAPLWSTLRAPDRLSYKRFLQMFKEPAARAGVEKPVTPTNLRKSNATRLAKMGAKEALIEDRQGRARGSEAIARYVARFGEESEAAQYAAMHGKDVDIETPDERVPVECPACERESPHDAPVCMWCGQALDAETADRIRSLKSHLRESLATSADREKRMAVVEMLEESDADPEVVTSVLAAFEDG